MTRHPVIPSLIIAVLSVNSGCNPYKDWVPEIDSGNLCYEDGTVYDADVILPEDPYNSARFTYNANEDEWGSGFLITAQAPSDISITEGDTLKVGIDGSAICLESAEISDHWYSYPGASPVASNYVANYNLSPCDNHAAEAEDAEAAGLRSVDIGIEFCDVENDYPGQPDMSTPTPPPEGTYTMSRSYNYYAGQAWFALLSRVSDRVCVLLSWHETGDSDPGYAVVMAQETVLSGTVKQYDLMEWSGLSFIDSNATLTVTASGSNRIVAGTTGSQTLDDFYELDGTWTFSSTSGPGTGWPPGVLHRAENICSNMLAH